MKSNLKALFEKSGKDKEPKGMKEGGKADKKLDVKQDEGLRQDDEERQEMSSFDKDLWMVREGRIPPKSGTLAQRTAKALAEWQAPAPGRVLAAWNRAKPTEKTTCQLDRETVNRVAAEVEARSKGEAK